MRPYSAPSQIVTLLQERGPLSRTEIEQSITGYAALYVRASIYALRRRGLIVQVRRACRYRSSLYGVV